MNKEVIIDIENPKDNDLISRRAVLDMLEDINAETEGVGFYYEHYVDYIKSLPSVKPQEPKWIPVSERLPEYGKEVLTCSNGGFIEIQSLEDGGYWENQKGDWTDFDEVVAWMPLPESYKGE